MFSSLSCRILQGSWKLQCASAVRTLFCGSPSAKPSVSCTFSRCFSDSPDGGSQPHPDAGQPMKFQTIEGLNAEEQRKFQILQFEAEVLRQSGFQVPSHIDEKNWRKILAFTSKAQRLKYFRFLFITEMKMLNIDRKKMEKAEARAERLKLRDKELEENPDAIVYGLGRNSMFPYIRDNNVLQYHNVLVSRMRALGKSPLILDFGFDQWMNEREQVNTAIQATLGYGYNRVSREPFWLQFCNLNRESRLFKTLEKSFANMYDPSCLIEMTEKSYLDLFPKERLVYLTSNAEFVLKEYNPDDIYIIGALVDKTQPKPLTMAKAKREGLRMAKLPIDLHLRWAIGTKNLTVNQMMAIMCDVNLHGNWEKALLSHIPKRKLFQPGDSPLRDMDEYPEPYHKRKIPKERLAANRRSVMAMMYDEEDDQRSRYRR